jgi:hypothetical protein
MALFQFYGSGDPIVAFNIDNTLVNKPIIPGEVRLQKPFPYPTLELWRRSAIQYSAATITTGSNDLATRIRTAVLFAHEADLGSIFFDLTKVTATELAGWYVDKLTAQAVDKSFAAAMTQKELAMRELASLGVPVQYQALLRSRLESAAFNHRVAGLCGAVYLTALLLSEANL